MKLRYLVLFVSLFSYAPPTRTATFIFGNNTATDTFTGNINSIAFDPCTSSFWAATTGDAAFSVSRLTRGATSFEAVGGNAFISGNNIETLEAANMPAGQAVTFLAAVDAATDTQMLALSPDGTTVTQSVVLQDATGAADTGGIQTNSVSASQNVIFAPVARNGSGVFDTTVGHGIAVIDVTATTLAQSPRNAATGVAAGNTAQRLDSTAAAANPLLFVGTEALTALTSPNTYWDEPLNRLYITMGSIADTGPAAAGEGVMALVVGRLDGAGILQLERSAPTAAITSTDDHIIGSFTAGGGSVQAELRFPKVMHTSTGLSYLIVNGGADFAGTNLDDNIWALPLVNAPGAAATLFGTIADDLPSAAGGQYTTTAKTFNIAATAASLDSSTAGVIRRKMVGNGPFPTAENGIGQIQDLVVVGDTVYASIDDTTSAGPANDNATGIQAGAFYSHAQFDPDGRIGAWTSWERLDAFSMFPVPSLTGRINKFAVDPTTGKSIIVDGQDTSRVHRTNWETGSLATDLPTVLNGALSDGCFCGLDLHKYTRGFTAGNGGSIATEAAGRYALFGGLNKVVFIKTSERTADTHITELPTADFSDVDNFLDTTLPGSPGPVTVLEYSHRVGGTADNYFFAGTPNGLFAFAATAGGGGFDVTGGAVNDLDVSPFSVSSWQKIDVPGLGDAVIIDIKSSGLALYCVTCVDRPSGQLPEIRVFRIPFAVTLATMFTTATVVEIANNAEAPFTDVSAFNGIQIVSTGPTATVNTREQLVLATSNGLFHSTASQAGALIGIADPAVTTPALALWQRFQGTEGKCFVGVAGSNPGYGDPPGSVSSIAQHTVWAIGVADDGTGTCERGRIYQTSVDADDAGTGLATAFVANGFDPLNFNAKSPTGGVDNLPFITGFWSDGGRRLFNTIPAFGAAHAFEAGAFDNSLHCQTALTRLSDEPAFGGVTSINCVTTTGYAGELVVGTDTGVVVLR